ncbi:hypothetical protein [Pedobacter sp. WC2423]|uniref:DUF6932 family protein n=1 Tax=Pedobacter sp. WC2423 TaxID=3234142 RepID=UPI003465A9F4
MDYLETEIDGSKFKNLLKNIWVGYDEDYSQNVLSEMGNLILKNTDYAGEEFRFLCWLFSKGILPKTSLNVPFIPDLVTLEQYNETSFRTEFLYCLRRQELFNALTKWISDFKMYIPTQNPINILIGGSFTDIGNTNPSDIDGIVLIPRAIWQVNPMKFFMGFITAVNPELKIKEFDFKFLPEGFDVQHFKGYNDISLLANNAQIRDSDGRMTNNSFTKRRVISLTI